MRRVLWHLNAPDAPNRFNLHPAPLPSRPVNRLRHYAAAVVLAERDPLRPHDRLPAPPARVDHGELEALGDAALVAVFHAVRDGITDDGVRALHPLALPRRAGVGVPHVHPA